MTIQKIEGENTDNQKVNNDYSEDRRWEHRQSKGKKTDTLKVKADSQMVKTGRLESTIHRKADG